MFPFPGSPQYVQTFGAQPDETAWERAHSFYLELFADKGFSDIQEQQPLVAGGARMRVLMTTDTVGGVWTFTQELTAGLLERGLAVCAGQLGRKPSVEQSKRGASAMEHGGSGFDFESRRGAAGVDAGQRRRPISDAEPSAAMTLREFEPDVFHSNQFCFGALRPIPKLVTAHSDVLSWAAACREAPLEDSAWLRQYQRLVSAGLAGADAVVAPTRWMLEALSRQLHVSRALQVIPNGREIVQPETRAAQAAGGHGRATLG